MCNLHFLVLLNSLCDFYLYFPCYKMSRLMSDIPLKRECSLSGILFSSNTLQCMPRKQNYIWNMTLTSADLYHSFRPLFCLQGNGTYALSLCLYKSCQSNGHIWTDRAAACLRNYPRHSIFHMYVTKHTQRQQHDQYIQMLFKYNTCVLSSGLFGSME